MKPRTWSGVGSALFHSLQKLQETGERTWKWGGVGPGSTGWKGVKEGDAELKLVKLAQGGTGRFGTQSFGASPEAIQLDSCSLAACLIFKMSSPIPGQSETQQPQKQAPEDKSIDRFLMSQRYSSLLACSCSRLHRPA